LTRTCSYIRMQRQCVFFIKDNDNQNFIVLFVISKLNKIKSYLYISFLAWFLRYFHWKQWAVMQPSSAIFDYWGYACNITRRGHARFLFWQREINLNPKLVLVYKANPSSDLTKTIVVRLIINPRWRTASSLLM
jgi:hypothetical protein